MHFGWITTWKARGGGLLTGCRISALVRAPREGRTLGWGGFRVLPSTVAFERFVDWGIAFKDRSSWT